MAQLVDVSVIIPAYKAEKYLPFAIRSALAQTGVTLEVIIADDASPTPMAPVVTEAAAGDARVRFVRWRRVGLWLFWTLMMSVGRGV